MKNSKITNKQNTILWTKRVTALVAISVWIAVLYKIVGNGDGFADQAPVCMFSTMGIFALLTGVYKALEYWEAQES